MSHTLGGMPMFPVGHTSRADADQAAQVEVIEQIPGEVELDKVIKAQSGSPHVASRMADLEDCVWSLAGILLLLPKEQRDKIGATHAIEQARFLLHHSQVRDHNLEIPE